MPWTTDSTGKSVWEGAYPDATAPLPETATATKAPPQRKPERVTPDKPWWERLKDAAVDVVEDVAPGLRYAPNAVETIQGLTQGKTPGFIDRAVNDVQYELNQLSSPETALPRLSHLAIKTVFPGDLGNTLSLGGAKASANVAKAVLDGGPQLVQDIATFELPIGNPSPVKNNPVGPNGPVPQRAIDLKAPSALTPAREGAIDQVLDNYYAATQESKIPSEMTPDELSGDDMRSSLVLNTALALGTGGVVGAIGSAYPALGRATQFLDPSQAQTFLGFMSRMAASNLVDEPLSTFLDDNTGGTWLGLFGAEADPVKPGMSRTEASKAAFWPNFGAAMILGGTLSAVAQGVKRLPNFRRAKTAQTAASTRATARAETEANGVQQKDETGKYSFTEETLRPEEAQNVEGRVQTDNGEPAVTGDAGPTEITYDPSVPEVDAAYEALQGNFSNDQLAQMNELQMQGVDTAVAIETVSNPAPAANAVNPDMAYDDVAAPKSNLAQGQDSISDRFGSVPQENLLSLASPQNSPALSEAISDATGKEWPDFNRFDILAAIERLDPDGRTVMPSRLMGQPILPINEIEADPKRFQFKQGVDDQGQQKGNSLSGVDVWNEDMEGAIQVWTDPIDGKTYVVNGHNRLAKAKKLRVPSMRVEYINAPTAEAARGKGAITNIAQGGGTSFDAAKFLRDSNITEPAQLEALGVPMRSGLATEGLALSKLPDNIFQDAVDGIVSKGKAMALGGSGLDETGMQQAYKALQSRDMTDSTFNEVLQQARSAPTVQGDQVDLFGNTDMLNLMVQKGELAARIRKDLLADKSLMARTAKNAKRLTEVGNDIDKVGTATLADNTKALLAAFDADKYMDGPTSELLNEGALQIENGAKVKVVADRIRRQLIEAAENTPAEKAVDPEVKPEVPEETVEVLPRDAQIKKILVTGAKKGELRPSSTPAIETPDPGKAPADGQRADVALLEGLDNEARLGEEWAAIDEAVDADRVEAKRKAIGYDEMTFDEKKGAGMLDGLEESKPRADLEAAARDISKMSPGQLQGRAEGLQKWVNAGRPPEQAVLDSKQAALDVIQRKGQILNLDKVPGIDMNQALNDMAMGKSTDATAAVRDAYMDFYGLKDKPRKLSDQMRGQLDDLGQSMGKFTRTVAEVMDRQTAGLADRLAAVDAEREVLEEMRPPELPQAKAESVGSRLKKKGLGMSGMPGDEPLQIDDGSRLVNIDSPAGRQILNSAGVTPEEATAYWVDKLKSQGIELPQVRAEFVIPKDLSKSAPRYGKFQLKFESDLDRAAYMLRDKAKKSKGEDRMIAALEEQGYDIDEVRALGGDVRDRIKLAAKNSGGGGGAYNQDILEIPSSTRDAGPSLSRTGPQLSRSGGYDEGKFRKRLERRAERKKSRQEAALLSIGSKLPSDIARLTQVSDALGREMVSGLKDAARISGLDPLRIQYLDQVDTRKLFGDADANQALEQWDPDAARFARENPDDPLMDIVDGETGGVFVPRNFPSIHRSMIYLAMGPSLDTRLVDKGLSVAGGTPLPRTAYHEAFHAVQDWLEMMSVKPGVRAGSTSMLEALSTDEAVAEMTELVKGDRLGNYQEGMSIKELQAEAFATWYNNRKVRMKAGGVQAAFEKIKKFVNTLRRKWKLAAGKDPSYVDVFELAAAGKIADKGNEAIAKLRPEQLEALKGRIDSNMDALLPDLTDRVQSYLKQKQADFDVLTDKLADETNMEGC